MYFPGFFFVFLFLSLAFFVQVYMTRGTVHGDLLPRAQHDIYESMMYRNVPKCKYVWIQY